MIIHETVPIQVWADIDVGIADLVAYLNTIPGVRTLASCEGGMTYGPQVLVSWRDESVLARLQKEFKVDLDGSDMLNGNAAYLYPRCGFTSNDTRIPVPCGRIWREHGPMYALSDDESDHLFQCKTYKDSVKRMQDDMALAVPQSEEPKAVAQDEKCNRMFAGSMFHTNDDFLCDKTKADDIHSPASMKLGRHVFSAPCVSREACVQKLYHRCAPYVAAAQGANCGNCAHASTVNGECTNCGAHIIHDFQPAQDEKCGFVYRDEVCGEDKWHDKHLVPHGGAKWTLETCHDFVPVQPQSDVYERTGIVVAFDMAQGMILAERLRFEVDSIIGLKNAGALANTIFDVIDFLDVSPPVESTIPGVVGDSRADEGDAIGAPIGDVSREWYNG